MKLPSLRVAVAPAKNSLSVSSNGSNWVKQREKLAQESARIAFSILERIELGETATKSRYRRAVSASFSILERIELGETLGTRDY